MRLTLQNNFFQVENPLQAARPFLTALQLHFPTTPITHLLSYEFYEREKKYLLMIRSLTRAAKYAEGGVKNPAVHLILMRFLKSGKKFSRLRT